MRIKLQRAAHSCNFLQPRNGDKNPPWRSWTIGALCQEKQNPNLRRLRNLPSSARKVAQFEQLAWLLTVGLSLGFPWQLWQSEYFIVLLKQTQSEKVHFRKAEVQFV